MPQKYLNKLEGTRVLVVGGTSGIGFCVAEASIEHGATVIVASSRQESIDRTIARITASYPEAAGRISGKTCNLASDDLEDQIIALYEFATNNGADKLDHVAVTAGDALNLTPISQVTLDITTRISRVRLVGSLLLTKHAPTYLNVSFKSSITFTSGVNGAKPGDGWAAVAPFATAIEGLGRGAAKDIKPIRVNVVSPGAVKTELFANFGDEAKQAAIVERYAKQTLTGHIGTPEDLAEAYLHMMKNWFVTGALTQIDGGYLLL
ncbi:hypothetical protein DRE_06976 [Drechslerella stenobrocha 248]|uniref:Uncharacterized protein n=1 Tax=Drechslerella stenobrocha 248 TaxID=1043628 RepID=W7HJN2_9PEZI|nr:hypothetical protein DRE_06976 [Drechslerella stenobrocha 248]